jgi:hypothetical protein
VPLLLYCGWEGCGVCVEEDGMEERRQLYGYTSGGG